MTPSFLIWDEYEIIKNQAEFLREESPQLSDDEAFNIASEDCDLLSWEWEYLTESLTDFLKEKNPDGYWHVEINDFGWQDRSGYKNFYAEDGQKFLQEILPNCDKTFRIYIEEDNIRIVCSHHDSPTGETYYVTVLQEEHLVSL